MEYMTDNLTKQKLLTIDLTLSTGTSEHSYAERNVFKIACHFSYHRPSVIQILPKEEWKQWLVRLKVIWQYKNFCTIFGTFYENPREFLALNQQLGERGMDFELLDLVCNFKNVFLSGIYFYLSNKLQTSVINDLRLR